MKRFKILILAIATVGLFGCENYLTQEPQDAFPDSPAFWSNETVLELETNYFYSAFQSYGTAHNGQYYSESISDDYCGGYSEFPATVPASNGVWTSSYREIRRANIILNRMKDMSLTDEARAHWEGFARFYRGLQHFDLVREFGDCVWVDTETDIDDSLTLSNPRNDRADVMKNACADMQYAGENCREGGQNTFGKYVAWALLSRAALYEAAWQKYHENNTTNAIYFYEIAKNAAYQIISSGKYSVHEDYASNYISPDLTGNSEMILFKQFIRNSNITIAHGLHGYSTSSTAIWGLTKSAVESFVNSDGLPIYQSPLGYSDATVDEAMANRDARLGHIANDSVLMLSNYSWLNGMNATTGYWTTKFVSWDYLWGSANNLAPYNDTDGPVYAYGEVLENYAEACAELASLGAYTITQNDLDISVNELREKHGKVPDLTLQGQDGVSVNGTVIQADPKNTFGVNTLLWELRRDRRSELMCDGQRYNDLMRWKMGSCLDFDKNPDGFVGASKDAVLAYINATYNDDIHDAESAEASINAVNEGQFWHDIEGKTYVSAFNVPSNWRKFDENKNYLSPIPSSESLLNPNLLPNNPGWE